MTYQAREHVTLPPAYHGCGDFPEWIAYEAAAMKRETRGDVVRRFTESLDLPPEIYAIVDGRVVKANGEPLEPFDAQIAKLTMTADQDQFREDRKRLKHLIELYSQMKGRDYAQRIDSESQPR